MSRFEILYELLCSQRIALLDDPSDIGRAIVLAVRSRRRTHRPQSAICRTAREREARVERVLLSLVSRHCATTRGPACARRDAVARGRWSRTGNSSGQARITLVRSAALCLMYNYLRLRVGVLVTCASYYTSICRPLARTQNCGGMARFSVHICPQVTRGRGVDTQLRIPLTGVFHPPSHGTDSLLEGLYSRVGSSSFRRTT